jgi:hypothetical protein
MCAALGREALVRALAEQSIRPPRRVVAGTASPRRRTESNGELAVPASVAEPTSTKLPGSLV